MSDILELLPLCGEHISTIKMRLKYIHSPSKSTVARNGQILEVAIWV